MSPLSGEGGGLPIYLQESGCLQGAPVSPSNPRAHLPASGVWRGAQQSSLASLDKGPWVLQAQVTGKLSPGGQQ